MSYRILILGASYGSLLGTRLLMARHDVALVCTRPTAELINRQGTVVRFPVRGHDVPVEVASKALPGKLSATAPDDADPEAYDLVVLAMQEAHYAARGVRDVMRRIARGRSARLAIMNMPPLAYLEGIPGLATGSLKHCYADAAVWEDFEPAAARALFGGAAHIERVDSLVAGIARQLGLQSGMVQGIVTLVDEHLRRNRPARRPAAALRERAEPADQADENQQRANYQSELVASG